MKKSRLVYAILLQLEYILTLITAVLLGAQDWLLFVIFLALTCALGLGTTAIYWHLMDGVK
jgi:hypothetical protein